jgi:hypothetical protein
MVLSERFLSREILAIPAAHAIRSRHFATDLPDALPDVS